MTIIQRPRSAFAAGLLLASFCAQAQTGLDGSFAWQNQGEQQAQRTARLLAAAQQPKPASLTYATSLPTSSSVKPYTVTRSTNTESANPAPVAETVAPPPMMMSSVPPPSAPSGTMAMAYTQVAGGSGVIPAMPDAVPGECFALVRIPEQYRTYQKEYEVRAASERIETIPPRYETVTEQYVAQEAFERLEVVPATFRTVTEQVETAAPSVRYSSTEPEYETVTERILETPARSVWKKGTGPIQRIDHATGEIMCLVEEPAVYKTVTRRVLKTPAQAVEVPVPGQYTTVSRRVTDRPAEVRRVVVPEQVATRTVRRQVEPGGVRRIPIPAVMGTTTVRELVEPARLEWRSVLCQTNMRPENISRVQSALLREGFNPGPINGVLNAQTMTALNNYQRARNLPEDQYLNMATVRALGAL